MRPSFLAFEPSLTCTWIGPWCRSMLKMLLITFIESLFLKCCVTPGGLWWTLSLLLSCLWCSFFSLLLAWAACRGVTIIESSLSIRQGDPLGGPIFVLAHYWTFLKTITEALGCVFLFLIDDTHIVGPLSEIIYVFDHLLTQLTLVGLRVKVSKCKLWSPSRIFPNIEIP